MLRLMAIFLWEWLAFPYAGLSDHRIYLEDSGNYDKPLALVLVTELFAIAAFLLGGPASHCRTTNSDEEQDTPTHSADQIDTNPGNDLKQVIGARHKVEPEPGWDAPLGSTGSTQIAKHQVGIQVGQLAEDEKRKTTVEEGWVGFVGSSSRIGAENPVRDIEAGENPVVSAVPEDVADGHSGIAETVDKESLELSFDEVHS